jgi:hypothetical protein
METHLEKVQIFDINDIVFFFIQFFNCSILCNSQEQLYSK